MKKLSVVKIGGNVIDDPIKLSNFLKLFKNLENAKILIHGGGKIATRTAKQLNIETKMVEGRRITDTAMRDVVIMVYGGLVNKDIVAQLQRLDCNAIGLSGADAGTVIAEKRLVKAIDYGWVGDIKSVNENSINSLVQSGFTPVFAPLSYSQKDGLLNTNADTMASAIATSLSEIYEVDLIYCFEKKGVLNNPDDDDSVIQNLDYQAFQDLKNNGVVYQGMIPKLDNAYEALRNGVRKVIICEADSLDQAANNTAGTQLSL